MDKNEQRHEAVLEKLVERLGKKPGFMFIHEEYKDEYGRIAGEMDIHLLKKTMNGKICHRYYEVKSTYSDGAEARAIQQFQKHKEHLGDNWKYILVTPQKVKRIFV